MSRTRDRSKRSITIVAIQVIASEVIGYIKIWQAVRSGFAPGTRKAVAIVIRIQSRRFSPLHKCGVTFVVQQAVGWPIAGVEVGNRIVVLIEAQVVAVQAEVNIKTPVPIVV